MWLPIQTVWSRHSDSWKVEDRSMISLPSLSQHWSSWMEQRLWYVCQWNKPSVSHLYTGSLWTRLSISMSWWMHTHFSLTPYPHHISTGSPGIIQELPNTLGPQCQSIPEHQSYNGSPKIIPRLPTPLATLCQSTPEHQNFTGSPRIIIIAGVTLVFRDPRSVVRPGIIPGLPV